MRKLTKVLAVLLTVAMLLGITVMLVNADASLSNTNLNLGLSGINSQSTGSYIFCNDYEDGTSNYSSPSSKSFTTHATLGIVDNAAGNNKYLQAQMTAPAQDATSEAYFFFYGASKSNDSVANGYGFVNNDYVVMDFEFGADKYLDNITGELTDSAKDAEGNDNLLAYPMTASGGYGLSLKFQVRIGSSGAFVFDKQFGIYPPNINTDGAWYLSWNGGASLKNTTLSKVAGEWNHITIVVELKNDITYYTNADYTGESYVGNYDSAIVDAINMNDLTGTYKSYRTNLSESKLHFFKDGEYMGSQTFIDSKYDLSAEWQAAYQAKQSSLNALDIHELRNQVAAVGFEGKPFSFAFDNNVVNYYKNGYNGPLKAFIDGIEENQDADITKLPDVVYKGTYDIPGVDRGASVLRQDIDDSDEFIVLNDIKSYDLVYGALQAVQAEQYVELFNDVTNYVPHTAFYVKWDPENVNFTLDSESGYQISAEPNSEGYYFVSEIPESQYVTVTWIYNLEDGDFDTQEVPVGGDLMREPDGLTAVDGKDYTYLLFKEWQYTLIDDVTNEEIWAPLTTETLTEELYRAAKDAEGSIFVRPIYEEVRANYAIIDYSNNIIEPKFDMATFDDDVKAGKRVMLTQNLSATSENNSGGYYIPIPQSVDAFIDLNGYTLDMSYLNYSAGGFTLGKNTTLTIISSAIGGRIDTPYGIARASTQPGIEFTIGTPGDYAGDEAKISLNVGFVMDSQNNYSSTRSLKVYGANIEKHASAAKSTLVKGSMPVVAVFDSCLIVTDTESAILGCGATATTAYFNVNFNNCVLIAQGAEGEYGRLFGNVANYSTTTGKNQITLNSCFVYGLLTPSDVNKEGFDTPINIVGNTRIASSETLPNSVAVVKPGYRLTNINESEDFVFTDLNTGLQRTVTFNFKYVEQLDINANIKTNNGFFVNFYVPTVLDATVSLTDGGDALSGEVVGNYTMYTLAVSTTSVDTVIIYISFGEDELVRTGISLEGYFNSVLDYFGTTGANAALVANAANYCNELYKVANSGESYVGYQNIVDNLNGLIIAPGILTNVKDVVSTDVIGGAQFIIGSGNVPVLALTKVADATVTIKYTDIYGNEATKTCEAVNYAGVEYYVASDMAVYDMIGTITVYANDTLVLTYSISDYINGTSDPVAIALYGYAKAVINFKKS